MNVGLHRLLQRLVSPFVAVRLTKEELCLSMAAMARFHLLHEELRGLPLDAIATRAQRVSHLCSPTELGMISDGASALSCTRADLADALISELYAAMGKGVLIRIAHVTAVLCYAAKIKMYYNETIPAIIFSARNMLHKNDTGIVLNSFLQLAQIYLSSEELSVVTNELRKGASGDQLKYIDSDSECVPPIVNKEPQNDPVDDNDNNNDEGDDDDDDDGRILWSAPRARKWMSQRVRRDGPWTPSEVVQAMELYAHFGVRDPVLEKKIDDAGRSVIPSASNMHRDEIRKIVLTFSHLFLGTSEILCQLRAESSDADNKTSKSNNNSVPLLEKSFKTLAAYERLLVGRRIPEDWMFEVMQEQNGSVPVDVAAQAACIFAERGEIPEGIILQLSTQLDKLSPQGVAAFLRAARRDSSGALLPHGATIFASFTEKGVREATVDTLLQLSAACALPLPRGTDAKNKDIFIRRQGDLAEAVITRLISVMSESSPISFLCKIARSIFAMDTNDEVVQFVCSSVCTRQDVVIDEALELLDMLCFRKCVNEPLLDKMEPILRRLVHSVVSKMKDGMEVPTVEARQLAKFAVLQAAFDAPDFEGSALSLLHAVEQHMDSTPIELFPAIGLLLLRNGRCVTVHTILDKFSGEVCKLSDEAVGELAELLSRLSGDAPIKKLVGELVTVVAERLAHQHALSPNVVGLAVAAHCRYSDAGDLIQANVVEYILEWIGALSSEVYTDICRVLHLSNIGELLTNAFLDEFPRRMNLLSISDIAHVVFGFGEVPGIGQRLSHQLVAESTSDYVVDHSHEFWSGKDIARLLYGFSRMLCTKRSLYNVFATRLAMRPILSTMDRETISLVVAAFGRSKYLDKKLFDKFSRRILKYSNDLQAADLMLAIRGFSRVMLLNDQLYNELGTKAAEKSEEFPLESQCALLASFGSLGIQHDKLATRMLDGIVEKMTELDNANKVVDIIASLWQMNHDVEDDTRVGELANWIVEKSEELNGESITKLCVVLSDTNWRHVPLLKAVAEQCVRLQIQKSVSAECCRIVLDTLGTFMVHHEGARENLSSLGRSVSKERIQLSEEEEQQIQLLLRR